MQPTCFCSVSSTSRFSSALKLEKFLWFSITVCQPWGLQEYSEGGKVRWVLNGWVLVWTHMRNWGGIHIPFKAAQAAQWRRNRSDFGRYNFLAANDNLCYKLLLASFPGSEAKLKRPLRCISLIIIMYCIIYGLIPSYERTFPHKVHHKMIEILVRWLGSPLTKVGRSLGNDYKSVYSFPHKLNIVLDGSEGLRTKLEYYIPWINYYCSLKVHT